MFNARQYVLAYFDEVTSRWLSRSVTKGSLIFPADTAAKAILDFAWEGWAVTRLGVVTHSGDIIETTTQITLVDYTNTFPALRLTDIVVRQYARQCLTELVKYAESDSLLDRFFYLSVQSNTTIGRHQSKYSFPVRSDKAQSYADYVVANLVMMFELTHDRAIEVVNEAFRNIGIGVEGEQSLLALDHDAISSDQYDDLVWDVIYQDSFAVTARRIYERIVLRKNRRKAYESLEDLAD